MTVPRREIFDPSEVGTYHCISRCVRRAFLCGFDIRSGKSFDHRKTWVRDRLTFLVQIFAIDLVSYAIMSNHLHSLVTNRPDVAARWSPQEVARKWRTLFPLGTPDSNEFSIGEIERNPKLVEKYRDRLSSISWFNRCLCEFIARRANREDECTGRFWEGRFTSKRVLELNGLLACSIYIDLNPIRAKIATTPEDSDFTSAQDRIRNRRHPTRETITPRLASIEEATSKKLTLDEYLNLLDVTGKTMIEGKGRIPSNIAPILTRLKVNPDEWMDTASYLNKKFKRAVGPAETILNVARRVGKQWFHGIRAAQVAFS